MEHGNQAGFPTIDENGLRMVGLYGPLNERSASQIVFSMMALRNSGERIKYNLTKEQKRLLKKAEMEGDEDFHIDEEDVASEIVFEPFKFLVSTGGGSVLEMNAILDTMNEIKKDMPIITHGVGKVMSAGILLLANGTKGKRLISRKTRLMIHGVSAGAFGALHDMENEIEEIKFAQEAYIETLAETSRMSIKQIKRMLSSKLNIYLDAEEAVKKGIADIVV